MEKLFGIPMDSLATVLLVSVGLMLATLAILGWRQRVMLRLGLRNIGRRRAQTALIVFGLMLSTLIISAAFSTGDTMAYSFRSLVLDEMGEADESIYAGGERDFFFSTSELSYFDRAHFDDLAQGVAQQQDAGDARALLIEALTPMLMQDAPVINRTARQNEPSANVIGYDAATADAFDELLTTDGEQVTIADLGPGEVYLRENTASSLLAEPGHELDIYLGASSTRVTVKAVVQAGALMGEVFIPLDQAQAASGQPEQINIIAVSNVGGPFDGARHSASVNLALRRLLEDTTLKVRNTKRQNLDQVELLGSAFTTIFIGFGSFSIAAGLLLIFLIFVMLAAERKQEMGMARAMGTQRNHLIQMFVFEGTAYDLAAAAVGALLGIVVGMATVSVLAEGLSNMTTAFTLRHHVEARSLVVAYCLGVLLTFVTVIVSSWRVSRLNIVAAIRDLSPPPTPDAGLRALFLGPWRHLGAALRYLLRLRVHRTLKRMLWDGPLSTLRFFWALIGRGPLLALLGFLSLAIGLSQHNQFLFSGGISLILISIGLMMRWFMRARMRDIRSETRDRVAFSFAGISLLIFWSLPFDALDFLDLPEFTGGPEMFVLAGIMMVAGAVWTIIYNSDLLLGLVTRLLSPFSNLLPVVRTAIAYPMSAKFRTGLTIAMFALIIFTLVFMSVFVNIFNRTFGAENLEELTGGFDIEIESSETNPIPDLSAAIAAAPDLNAADYVGIAGLALRYVDARQVNVEGDWLSYSIRVVDDGYLEHMAPDLTLLADDYDTPEAAWQAVREDPSLAIIDSFVVPYHGSFAFSAGGPQFKIEGVYQQDEHFEPVPIKVRDPNTGTELDLTIIGVAQEGPFFMTGIFVSQQTWRARMGQGAPPTEHYIRLADGVDDTETAQALESQFLEHGLDATPIMAEIEASRGMNDSMMGLIQAFMGLGLVVGIAALGVISTRAVVERRHQIGVLRAIGYQPWMIQWSFLLESTFVSLLGILIGLALGLTLAYNFYQGEVVGASIGLELSFVIPWTNLGIIVAIAYGASMLTTYLPAWQAARVYPADALRYE